MKKGLRYVLALAMIWPAAAEAQDWGTGYWSTTLPAVAGTDTLGLQLRNQMRNQRQRDVRTAPPTVRALRQADPDAPAPDFTVLRYTPSKARRAANLAQFVSKTRKIDAGNAQDLERLFAQGDYIDKVGKVLAPLGLGVDNVADAYAIWMICAWNATKGRNDTPSRNMAQAVRGQIARALDSTPGLTGASDATKQELAESLLVQMSLVDVGVEQNKNDPNGMQRFGSAVNQGAKQMGIDLTTLELTDNGFVPASTGSATPAKSPIRQAAAIDRPSGQASPASAWLAAAATGGVGLGSYLLLRRRGA